MEEAAKGYTKTLWGLHEPLDYDESLAFVRKGVTPQLGRPLNWGGFKAHIENDTTPPNMGPAVVIRKEYCSIVELWPDGSYVLGRGHYRGKRVLECINAFSPVSIVSDGPDWIFDSGHLFVDGCRVSAEGTPNTPDKWVSADVLKPHIHKFIKSYCRAAERAEPDVRHPSATGCWDCYYYASPRIGGYKVPAGAEPGGVGHLFQHIMRHEHYGTLAYKALQECGNKTSTGDWGQTMGTPFTPTDSPVLTRILSTHLFRRMGMLGAFANKAGKVSE